MTGQRLLRQGIALLEQFARDNRIRIRQPKRNMQKKIVRSLSHGNEFVAYVDAIGQLDGTRRLLEWKKTTSARYPGRAPGSDLSSSIFSSCATPGPRAFATSPLWLL